MHANVRSTPEKRCMICGTRFSRKRLASGRLEDRSGYLKRDFCSLSCANSRSKGGLSRKAFHARARKLRKIACEACGSTARLHAHHINEDWTDNTPSNIQTLCIFCHQFWHATHRRLGLKPSTRMPALPFLLPPDSPIEWDDCAPMATRCTARKSRNSSSRLTKQSEPSHD